VAAPTGEAYADHLGPSDMPVVEITASETLEGFCETGQMVCDIFKKLGATCKAGTKTNDCPQLKKKAKKAQAAVPAAAGVDPATLIGPDLPFDFQEVAAATGPEYVQRLVYEGSVQMPYEELKARMAALEAAEEAPRADVVAFPAEPATRHILVVDDEAAVNNNIRKILAKSGYHVDQALTREEALDKVARRTYKLVLLDLKMPGVTGLDLLRAISQAAPRTRVIMITGYASIDTAVEAARIGAVGYLPKPFTPDEIRNAAEEALTLAA
jgi:CheY-like chemotaxis protein